MPDAARPFPAGFTWGTATAAHQIEGGNTNNDWWAFEHTEGSGCAESSGDACDSWHHWDRDVALVADLGLGTYRFSVEWSRIEPADGEISRAALDHYRRLCAALRQRGVAPVVTFHHFTTPRWLAERGGWERPDTPERFGRFCEVTAGALGDLMASACTINEPNMVASMGFRGGMFPPGKHDRDLAALVADRLVAGHRRAVEAVRQVAGTPVGLTLSMTDYQALPGGEERRDRMRRREEDVYLEATEGDDFVGVQTYTRAVIGADGWAPFPPDARVVDMGYEFWPEALGACVRRAAEVTGGLPLVVTENGIGTTDDAERIEFVGRALHSLRDAMDDGVDVRGYTYWSLLDNFEWAFGYRPRFGLVEVDRSTFERRPKPSARWLAQVAAANAVPPLA